MKSSLTSCYLLPAPALRCGAERRAGMCPPHSPPGRTAHIPGAQAGLEVPGLPSPRVWPGVSPRMTSGSRGLSAQEVRSSPLPALVPSRDEAQDAGCGNRKSMPIPSPGSHWSPAAEAKPAQLDPDRPPALPAPTYSVSCPHPQGLPAPTYCISCPHPKGLPASTPRASHARRKHGS